MSRCFPSDPFRRTHSRHEAVLNRWLDWFDGHQLDPSTVEEISDFALNVRSGAIRPVVRVMQPLAKRVNRVSLRIFAQRAKCFVPLWRLDAEERTIERGDDRRRRVDG